MNIFIETEINDPDNLLPIADPYAALITPDIIAGWDGLSLEDFSGNGNTLKFSGQFDNLGMILDGTENSVIESPVFERTEFTQIHAWFAQLSPSTYSLWSNFYTTASPLYREGSRFTQLNNTTVGQIDIATTRENAAMYSTQSGISGGWTIRSFAINDESLQITTKGNDVRTVALTMRNKGTKYPIALSGIPADRMANVGSVTANPTGHYCFGVMYNRKLSSAECLEKMNIIIQILQDRGVPI